MVIFIIIFASVSFTLNSSPIVCSENLVVIDTEELSFEMF